MALLNPLTLIGGYPTTGNIHVEEHVGSRI